MCSLILTALCMEWASGSLDIASLQGLNNATGWNQQPSGQFSLSAPSLIWSSHACVCRERSLASDTPSESALMSPTSSTLFYNISCALSQIVHFGLKPCSVRRQAKAYNTTPAVLLSSPCLVGKHSLSSCGIPQGTPPLSPLSVSTRKTD